MSSMDKDNWWRTWTQPIGDLLANWFITGVKYKVTATIATQRRKINVAITPITRFALLKLFCSALKEKKETFYKSGWTRLEILKSKISRNPKLLRSYRNSLKGCTKARKNCTCDSWKISIELIWQISIIRIIWCYA